MTVGLASDADGRLAGESETALADLAARATALGLGPGLGRSAGLDRLVVSLYQRLPLPVVVDADALNALAAHRAALAKPGGPRILTPHPGEFARLVDRRPASPAERLRLATELAVPSTVVVVLKGHRTLVTDGRVRAVNRTGNPGMASGGSGDVLTGVITALLCQGLGPVEAARLGVHLHGLAGDLAAARLGQVGMIARDLVRYLPRAVMRHQAR
jgi:NAD(P)H-hydrate epimerase